ncbi:MAG: hypothetical protein MZV70_48920 [Desulfobacterales bacterium]|nr:hypothetical protein [Desulfobacterales bacterium]
MAVSYLHDAFGDEPGRPGPARPAGGRRRQGAALMREMIAKRINSPLTSSLGRLFDGVAAHRRPAVTGQLRGPGGHGARDGGRGTTTEAVL